jgi:hypothetical protein
MSMDSFSKINFLISSRLWRSLTQLHCFLLFLSVFILFSLKASWSIAISTSNLRKIISCSIEYRWFLWFSLVSSLKFIPYTHNCSTKRAWICNQEFNQKSGKIFSVAWKQFESILQASNIVYKVLLFPNFYFAKAQLAHLRFKDSLDKFISYIIWLRLRVESLGLQFYEMRDRSMIIYLFLYIAPYIIPL